MRHFGYARPPALAQPGWYELAHRSPWQIAQSTISKERPRSRRPDHPQFATLNRTLEEFSLERTTEPTERLHRRGVRDPRGKTARTWTKIVAAFPHADGVGFNLELKALPVEGKLVLRPPSEERAERPEGQGTAEGRPTRREAVKRLICDSKELTQDVAADQW
jgi:hypothetical protein